MNNHPIYILTIIRLNGEVIQEESNTAPTIKKPYITNNGLFISFEKVVETNEVIDRNFVRKYITCIERKPFDNDKVGVLQVKFINGNSYDAVEAKLNEFLFENRYTHQIVAIEHTMAYVAVHYKLRNEKEIYTYTKWLEEHQKQK
jgi:hypothetical protein